MIGIISAFAASISWTYACFLWRAQTNYIKPIDINFLKNLLAFLVFSPVLLSFNDVLEYRYFIILILSGIIGIGLGDTFYLKSLKLIGTRKTLTIEALSPLIAAFSGQLFINEYLSINSWIGIFVVSTSLIILIKKENNLFDSNGTLVPIHLKFENYIYSFLSVFCAVIAALLSRLVFLETNLSPIQTTEIRLLGSIIFLIIFTKIKLNIFIINLDKKEKMKFIFSVLLGTNIGIFLQQVVFQTLQLGIGWTLLSTSPVISLFIARKEEGKLDNINIFFTIFLFIGIGLVIL